ncbi:MAG: PIN domain nuclease [Candidatus Sericytochromatia bacterium]|nr:PIN domain nuclease [Candidatus Sericytochromatia bacterium]
MLVDTSVWIDFFNGVSTPQSEALDRYLQTEQILMGDLILAEVLQGFRRETDFQTACSLLQALPCVSLCSPALALQSAQHFRRLRQKGLTVRKTIDCLIATWCITHQAPLLYADRDFEPFVTHLGLRSAGA